MPIEVADLLHHYSFDMGNESIDGVLTEWLQHHSADWVRLAIVEALHQGRYKAVSVEQILSLWQRRGQPMPRFNQEFERLVCQNLPRSLIPETAAIVTDAIGVETESVVAGTDSTASLTSSTLQRFPALQKWLGHPDAQATKPNLQVFSEELAELRSLESSLTAAKPTPAKPAPAEPAPAKPAAKDEAWRHKSRQNRARLAAVLEALEGQTMGATVSLLPSNPSRNLASFPYQPTWLQRSSQPEAIDQFVPQPKTVNLHEKLKAVAETEQGKVNGLEPSE